MGFLVHLILWWLIAAGVLLVLDRLDFGLGVDSFSAALVTAAVIALLQLLVAPVVALVDIFTLSLLTWLLRWVAAAVVLVIADRLLPGFTVKNWVSAFIGAAAMALLMALVDVVL